MSKTKYTLVESTAEVVSLTLGVDLETATWLVDVTELQKNINTQGKP